MKNTLLQFILVASIFSLGGGFIGWKMANGPSAGTESATTEAASYRDLKLKLEQLSRVDVEEYLRLKDAKERYDKAEEILGKILTIMLYDLGIRATSHQLERMKVAVADGVSMAPVASHASQAPENSGASPIARAQPTAEWKKETFKVNEIVSEKEVHDFLKNVEITDLVTEFRSGGSLSDKQFELLNGVYEGMAIFEDPAEKPWRVHLWLRGRIADGKYRGRHEIRLFKNGKQFSRSRGGVNDETYRSINGDPNGILINAYENNGFFQLYYFPKLNQLHGLVYLQKTVGTFERKGTVVLNRR